jgi:hypothetical protein
MQNSKIGDAKAAEPAKAKRSRRREKEGLSFSPICPTATRKTSLLGLQICEGLCSCSDQSESSILPRDFAVEQICKTAQLLNCEPSCLSTLIVLIRLDIIVIRD